MTLVARTGGERLTIDRGLQFWDVSSKETTANNMLVIETKSAFGRGTADSILRKMGFHPIGSCSKYCIGLAALGQVPRFNKFMPAFRRLLPHRIENGGTRDGQSASAHDDTANASDKDRAKAA